MVRLKQMSSSLSCAVSFFIADIARRSVPLSCV